MGLLFLTNVYARKMSFRKIRTILPVALAFIAVVACKKEEESTTYPSLEGRVSFDLEPYLGQNETVTMTAEGAEHPEGGEITYSWSISPEIDADEDEDSDKDEGPVFTQNFGTEFRTYSVTCSASASGYNGISTTRTTTIVKGGLDGTGSITGIDISGAAGTVTDTEGNEYHYTAIGSLDWFIQNLASKESGQDGKEYGIPYDNADIMSDIFGRYYSYEDALNACPEGWRLPSEEEWESCFGESGSGDLMVKSQFNGTEMWEFWPEVKITNSTGFCAIPAGYANIESRSFSGLYGWAAFWVASDGDASSEDMAPVKYIREDNPEIQTFMADKASFGASVRCVRDHQDTI